MYITSRIDMGTMDLALIQKLRERTGIGMMDCKKALQESNGDIEKAIEILRKKGAAVATKRANNTMAAGLIHAYIHSGSKVGVLLEINCETDFVAHNDEMKRFAQDVSMHIAAFKPKYIAPADVDEDFLSKEKDILRAQLDSSKKPASIIDQIIEGKLQKLYTDFCLLNQPFVKNDKITVDEVLKGLIAKMGENIKIKRFVRFEIGE
jgi:elongation factor Ts